MLVVIRNLQKQLRERDVGSVLPLTCLSMPPSPDGQSVPAEVIAKEIMDSDAFFVLLSDAVSEAYWTQAWIGFEIGVARGSDLALYRQEDYGPDFDTSYYHKKIIVVQDVRQGIKVSIPWLRALVLFDFANKEGWEQYQNMLWVMALKDPSLELFQKGNRFRTGFMKASIQCKNDKCRGRYETWISIQDFRKLRGHHRLIATEPVVHTECEIDCPSCDKTVTDCFEQVFPY